ncbi:MAG: hypothetical protein LUE93_16165, partial [Bacteroides sp.]|nr:hypothetical protein [Bacteroides sp.]
SNTGAVLENSFLKGDDFPVNPCNIAIDSITGNIWIGSHKTITSYSNEGEVYCFDENGKLLKKYNVGVGPSAFAFIH